MIKIKSVKPPTHLSKTVRSLRLLNRLTQQQVAKAIGVDRSTYTYYENGKTHPSTQTLLALAQFFGVSVDYLLCGKAGGVLFLPPPALASRKHLSYNRLILTNERCGMKFQLALLAVKDVEASKKFYHDLFGQEVVLDLGKNVTFSGGFAIQEDFEWLTSLPAGSAAWKPHNMELYFETEDFDAFLQKLEAYPSVEYVHPPKIHEWNQRVVRVYDPDGHMIEIGESMEEIAKRYLRDGLSVPEVARLIQHPIEFVRAVVDGLSTKETPAKI